METVL